MDGVPAGQVKVSEDIQISELRGKGELLRNAAGLWLYIENSIPLLHVKGRRPVINGLPHGVFNSNGIFVVIKRYAQFGRILSVGLVFNAGLCAEQPLL